LLADLPAEHAAASVKLSGAHALSEAAHVQFATLTEAYELIHGKGGDAICLLARGRGTFRMPRVERVPA